MKQLPFVLMFCLPVLHAAAIGSGDFVNPIIDTYDGLGLSVPNPAPVLINGNTYTTNDGILRYVTGTCVANECIGSNVDLGYIDVVLGTPTLRAGGWIGLAPAQIDFFNQADTLLGSVILGDASTTMQFAGWQADTGLIGRIRITDLAPFHNIIRLDNLTVETVPEPPTAYLLCAAISVVGLLRKRLLSQN